ncbi:hypothetical protein KY285_001483 [Solanum tuberosum]|nr:hypothetical protein KY285_001483 [Solanum tuberosum]
MAGELATSIESMQSNCSMDIPKENCQRGEIRADEMIPDVERGKSNGKEEHDEGDLLVESVTQIAFSMKLCCPCKDCSTIVVDELKDILKTSTRHIANTVIDQRLLTQYQFNFGATTFVVCVCGIASNLCVWESRN